jgi:hypothetical protein
MSRYRKPKHQCSELTKEKLDKIRIQLEHSPVNISEPCTRMGESKGTKGKVLTFLSFGLWQPCSPKITPWDFFLWGY